MHLLSSLRPKLKAFGLMAAALTLVACSTPSYQRSGPSPHYKVGKPYKINGRWYRPAVDPDYVETGVASWYGSQFHGRKTANGEIFNMNLLSAAHTTLPMPSMAEVTNLENGRRIVVRVNDRGPFAKNRLIDLSREAARRLGFEKQGVARVKVAYLGPAPLSAKAPSHSGDAARYAAYAKEQHPIKYQRPARAPVAAVPRPQSTLQPVETMEPARIINASLELAPEPVAAAPIEPAAPVAQLDKLYVIRIAALSRLDNLDQLEAQMKPIGPLRLSRIDTADEKVLYRVSMGPFRTAEAAAGPLERVRDAGYADAAIVAVTP